MVIDIKAVFSISKKSFSSSEGNTLRNWIYLSSTISFTKISICRKTEIVTSKDLLASNHNFTCRPVNKSKRLR